MAETDTSPELTAAELESKKEALKSLIDSFKAAEASVFGGTEEQVNRINEAIKEQITNLKNLRDAYISIGKLDEAKKLSDQIKDLNNELEDAAKKADTLGKRFGESFKKAAKEAGSAMQDKFLKPISVETTLNAIPALDKLQAQFVKNTGATREFTKNITRLQGDLANLGLSNQEMSAAFQGLYLNFNRFGLESQSTNDKLVKVAAQFTKMGVSSEQFGENLTQTMTTFGQTSDQAVKTQVDLANAAKGLNISVTDLNRQYLSSMKDFAIYGKRGTEEFLKFTAAAKATGMQVQTLVSLGERMSTFEESGQFAGRLNALAGKDIFDAVTLASKEGEEKIEYIRQGLMRGFDIENMSPARLRALSKSAGIDVQDLMKMTGKGATDIGALEKKIKEQQARGEKGVAETAEDATTREEKLLAIQEKQRNKFIEATNALEIYSKVMSYATKITGLASAASTIFTGALATATIRLGLMNNIPIPGGAAATKGLGAITNMSTGMARGLSVGGGLLAGGISGYMKYKETGDAKKGLKQGASVGAGTIIGGIAGTALLGPGIGTALGAMAGSALGEMAGNYFTEDTPIEDGEYDVKTNNLSRKGFGTLKPKPKDSYLVTKDGYAQKLHPEDKVSIGPNVGGMREFIAAVDGLKSELTKNTEATLGNTTASKPSSSNRANNQFSSMA